MNDVTKFIESGILEMYVLGQATETEAAEVDYMRSIYEQVNEEIEAISIALENYALTLATEPDPLTGPFLMAKIDFMERMKAGEAPSFPPVINEHSRIADYNEWLLRPDLQQEIPEEEVEIRIIGYTPEVSTAIVWLRNGAPPEIHHDEIEQFMIVEGSCEIIIDDVEVHSLVPGSVFKMPMHKVHRVNVTSIEPCKILLQRIAA